MWSKVALLCLLATAAFTQQDQPSPAWKENTEYIYTVRGRTLTSLTDVSDHYSGIQLKAKLHLTLRSNGRLSGRLVEPQYAQIHTHLPRGWDQTIPDSELNYKQLSWNDKPFEMEIEHGLIRALIVEKDLANWEVNMIKSLVSQFQLDIQGQNAIESPLNIQGNKNDAVFKTLEETITGQTETTYNVHELREYYIQAQPELVPLRHLKGDSPVIEVIKSKNFTNSYERPSYHFGLKEINEKEPTGNSLEDLMTRTSNSRVILTGKLSRFTVQSIYTVDKIFVSPVWNQKDMGSVVSALNITLRQVQTRSGDVQELSNPIKVGDLVYTYANPSAKQVEEKRYGSEESSEESSEEHLRYRRFAPQMIEKLTQRQNQKLRQQTQPAPKMEYAPELPLLPFFIGYHGKSIKESGSFDVKQQVKKIALDISKDLKDSEAILKQATLSKYTILSSLIRLMNEQELRSVSEEIFSLSQQEGQKDLWAVFRDAVAETGTGPAFLTIQDWIDTRKVKHHEASSVIATMAASVRTPTEQYMRKFFELVRSNNVVSQSGVNETAILSYGNLVYQVYVNKNVSHSQYPVHSFGQFRTQEGKQFIKETVIPYLAQQLDKAILEADTRKIHVYIRALGNVGHKKILSAFEKYLEGNKQASQFQRLMMVVCLEKLSIAYPEIARAVLYRIYQNSGELQQIRVAAVYQLMRTNPPKEMIQQMAQQTNFDKQLEVNAAVKSAIENLARLRSPRHEQLRQAGESAKHLLSKKIYGVQNSMYLQDYVLRGLEEEWVYHVQSMSQAESYMPNALKLTLNKNMNEVQFFNFEAMVSSIKELMNVLKKQTQTYQEEMRQQQSGQSKYSSPNIAELLKLDINNKEQLEGFLYSEMGILGRILSFDNRSMEHLPEYIRQQEDMLRKGEQFSYTKLGHGKELALSFPTLMGLPFLYTYDIPLLMKIQTKAKLSATPAISQNMKLVRPDNLYAEVESEIVVTGKIESHLSFITPFDHQQYFSGYNRNLQLRVPISAQIQVDLKNKESKIEIDTSRVQEKRIAHFSSWPYTSRSDIMTTIPVALRPNTQYIKPKQVRSMDLIVGQKSTGIAFRVWGRHQEEALSLGELAQVWNSEGPVAALEKLIKGTHMGECEINVAPVPEQTTTKKITLGMNHKSKYVKSEENQNEDVAQLFNKDLSKQSERQKEMLKLTSSGLRSADVSSCDMMVEFNGHKDKQFSLTLGIGKSNVHPRGNLYLYLRKDNEQKVSQAALKLNANIPNTNGLDMLYSMEHEPTAKYEYQVLLQNSEQKLSELQGKFEMRRSEERKEYLTTVPEYQECKREIQQGNRQLTACANMTIRANFFDKLEFELRSKNLNEQFKRTVEDIYRVAKMYFYPASEVTSQGTQDETIRFVAKFQPDFEYVNVTLQSREEKLKIQDIGINHLIKPIVMAHPVFHLKSRVLGQLAGLENFRRSCVLDMTAARTFNGLIYPVESFEQWTVLMQYVPRQAKQHEQTISQQLKKQVENFVVLVRQESQHKELKMVVNSPETQGKEVEITLKANPNGAPIVIVDEQKLRLSEQENTDELYNGYIQAYQLPNNEVKVELRGAFYIIFDGRRVKLTTVSDKLSLSTVGLCGRNENDVHSDMLTPENCVVDSPKHLIESYKLEGNRRFRDQKQCIPEELPLYVNVISGQESGKWASLEHQQKGTKLQPRYIEEGDQICFTTRAVPVCKQGALRTISKELPVHCVDNTRTAQLFKKQIDQGGNPDFSRKQVTKMLTMEVDQQCA